MTGSRLTVLVLSGLMLSVWSGAVSASSDLTHQSQHESNSETLFEQSSWYSATPTLSDYGLRQSTGIIHSPYGPFDPLIDPIPLGPENLYDPLALERTGMAIVQSSSADLTEMLAVLHELELPVIDMLPDDSTIVRVDAIHNPSIISTLVDEKSIRWAGALPIAWRVSPELSFFAGRGGVQVDIDITPTPDLELRDITALSLDLQSISGDSSDRPICDQYLCQTRLIDSYWIPILAMDGRILRADIASIYAIQNTNASLIGGIHDARLTSGLSLNGSGEVLAISDTGLDEDHGDFGNRIRAIYDQFGPDNSHADSNSGHGTHVSATLLGDGSGDIEAEGMVPAATFHFYQLEADSNGLLARWGSLYEMFSHSWQNNARIQTNSWGNQNLAGDYSSDSRSADSFLVDYPRFLVLFSAGDLAGGGITPPGTAKNVITVGASTTGSFGSSAEGSVASFSSRGTTADGRIKPDIVAPGVAICSARAQEAQLASGDSCSSTTHDGGQTPLYMTLDGSSMATPVAAGAATMVRQYLRESQLITEPRSDLIKAVLINGAEDIGESNIPNSAEGWGQLNLENSLFPSSSDQSLNLFYDYSRELLPGHSFVYTFDVNGNYGLDVTVVWIDEEGSAVADQSASRLVNDLDLRAVSPEGEVYLGNNFASGFSATGGSEDRLNNVERIRIPTGSSSGTWSIIVGHAGGTVQNYAIVLSGLASETQSPDLTVFSDSLSTSVSSPLQGDTLLIEAAWKNQAAAPTGTYSIEVKDLTAGTTIHSSVRASLAGGTLDSVSFPHSFSTTGMHELELRLDSDSEVSELNDETSGVDNNWIRIFVNVSQIGVRLTPLMEDGTVPSNPAELSQAMVRTLDPRDASWVLFELEMRNEGTAEISVGLSVSPVQLIGDDGVLYQPQDEWWKLINESGPWTLAPFGEEGDRTVVTLNMSDMDTDLSSESDVIYALPGTFVSDLTLFDTSSPTVSHSIRLSAVVERVEGLFTVVAGTEGLGAEPGELAVFSLSIKNTGNGPTQYTVSCESTDRWTISIGNSQSSEITLEPLSRLQFLPLPIRVRVPNAVDGNPPAGFTEEVECTTTSVIDQSLQTTEHAIVTVLESLDFSPELFDSDGNALGPIAVANPRPVLNGDTIVTDLLISNEGNVPMDFTVNAFSSLNTWPIQMTEGSNVQSEEMFISIPAGGSKTISIATIVPLTAQMGDSNLITVRTTLEEGPTITNSTRLLVQEIATLDLSWNPVMSVALGTPGTADIHAHNIGNIELEISLTMGTLPEGWSGGFLSGREFPMDMNQQATIEVGIDLPGSLSVGLLETQVSVIIEARTPSGETAVYTTEMAIEVIPSVWLTVSCEQGSLEGISTDGETLEITVSNIGNTPSDAELQIIPPDNWDIVADQNAFSLAAGESAKVSVSITPGSDASNGLTSILFYVNSTVDGELTAITDGSFEFGISKARDSSRGGLGGLLEAIGLPDWTLALIFIALLSSAVVYGVRMRKSSSTLVNPDEELIPEGSALLSGSLSERRAAALETSSSGEVLTGGVSDDEIQTALAQSAASAPPPSPDGAPPLPLSGLPDGWTIEQWAAYGHLWWEQNKP